MRSGDSDSGPARNRNSQPFAPCPSSCWQLVVDHPMVTLFCHGHTVGTAESHAAGQRRLLRRDCKGSRAAVHNLSEAAAVCSDSGWPLSLPEATAAGPGGPHLNV